MVIVFGVSYFMTDRIFLRAAQLSQGTMAPEYKPMGWVYASIITALFGLCFWIFIRDIAREDA